MTTAISPLSPGSKLDGWETPITSTQNSPIPEKCFELPDYDPKQRRNHHRSSDSTWNSGDYPKQAPPLPVEQIPKRPKPTRLATPRTGYPFPYVLSRGNTPETLPTLNSSTGQPATTPLMNSMSTNSPPEGSDTSSNASSSDSRPPSSSFSDHSSSSSNASSSCSTPKDEPPQPTTPSEVQERRTKNASRTPGAPPPMGFISTEEDNDNEDTPRKPLNPLVSKLQALSIERKFE
ncbi:hypothetical protein JCM5353_001400 [Sporobolomyces roseus]